MTMKYDRVYTAVGEGHSGLAPAKATCSASQTGKLVDHWDTIETSAARAVTGKF
jgi:hypothetical protein